MNNAFPFVEAGGKETNGSLMGLMRLGSMVDGRWRRRVLGGGGGRAGAPASKATSRKDCCGVEGEGFVRVLAWNCCFHFSLFQSLSLTPKLVVFSLCF